MLESAAVVAFAPTTDLSRARGFYRDVLGLTPLHEDGFACVFDANGTALRVNLVEQLTPAPFTILGWTVTDVHETVRGLGARGVEFLKFDRMGQDELGVWPAPGGALVAWFHDPDGNTLSLTQNP